MIRVSNKNTKLGKIPNISLVPVADCGNCEACKSDCYALKAYRQYHSVRKAWKDNSKAFRRNMPKAFLELDTWFHSKRKPPRFFRIHVAGDFLNQEHVDRWVQFAQLWPNTKFLAFTKMHDLDYSSIPDNMVVVLSQWPTLPETTNGMPRAWVQDGYEDRIPYDAIECPGFCESCAMCWNLHKLGVDVYFNLH